MEFYGELALGGELMPVEGLLLASAHAAEAGHEMIVPPPNADEAFTATGAAVRAARHLKDVCGHIAGSELLSLHARPSCSPRRLATTRWTCTTFAASCRRSARSPLRRLARTVFLMVGPPGSGKSMLAQRLPGLLPPLTSAEALEVATIASASGSGFDARQFGRRPFRSPHHTASMVAPRRRWRERAAGRGQPRASRHSVPRRAAGVRAPRAGSAARAAGNRLHLRVSRRHAGGVSGGVSARRRDESVPVWISRRS